MLNPDLSFESLNLSHDHASEKRIHLRSDSKSLSVGRGLDYQLLSGSLHAMSRALDARDPYTQSHSERVAHLAFELAGILGLSKEASYEIYLAGILHDIGKIGIPDAVLLKADALSEEDIKSVRRHPEIGYLIVERVSTLQFALPGILYHHERWDGKGYPHGLAGESVPLMARILAVADAFDAMTSCRPYRTAMPLERALAIIEAGRASQWDAAIVDCFEIWLNERNSTQRVPVMPPHSIIPQGSPVEYIHRAIVTLSH